MYLQAIADQVRANLPPGTAVPADSEDLFRLYAVLVRVKGSATTLEDVHDTWVAWEATRNPTHAALVPFDELPPTVQAEDAPLLQAIQATSVALD